MKAQPIELNVAKQFVNDHHRHHKAPIGHKFSIGCFEGDLLIGVAIVGRPVSRALDKRGALEVTRLCTLGGKNVCSFLYAACARHAAKIGCKWIITYILISEIGTSLKATGWIRTITTAGGSWNCKGRPRSSVYSGTEMPIPTLKKVRYEKYLTPSYTLDQHNRCRAKNILS